MKLITFFCIVSINLLISGCEKSEKVSFDDEQAILNISEEVMKASVLEDVPRLLSFLDKNTVLNVVKEGKDPYSYDYDSYGEYLLQVFSIIDGYQYVRSNEEFRMGESGKIFFEFDLNEEYEYSGETIKEYHSEVWEIRKVGGEYKILSILVK
jgi:hypothetical protein